MAKNIIGIDISDFSIEAVALEKSKKSFKLESYSRFRLSPEIVEDGKILNKEKLKEAILKMFKNAKPIPFETSRKVFLSVPESQTFSKVLDIPKSIKEKELERAAINKAEEFVPESVDSLTAVVKVLSESENNHQVLYYGAETEVLKDFVNIFTELDIELEGITTEANSSFAGIQANKDKKNILVLDLGSRTTIASVFTKDGLHSNININIGGNNISQAIASKLNIPYEQAEEEKIKIGLTPDKYGEIMLISQGQLQPLVDELKVFIKYWQKSTKQTIDQVVLIGGLSQMKDADKYFGDDLNLPTTMGKPFIDIASLPKHLEVSKYINALGLAKLAHQDTDINFYKKLAKEKKQQDKENKNKQEKNKPEDKKQTFITRLKKIFKNKYVLIGLSLLVIAGGVFYFKDYIPFLGEKTLPTWEEKIFVAIENPNNLDNFIVGEYYEPSFYKVYATSTDETLTEDYVENFDNNLTNLERQANEILFDNIEKKYTPEGYYVIPKILSYESVDIIPSEENYEIGDGLEASINYRLMMFSEQALKDWIITKDPAKVDNIEKLDYEVINYSLTEDKHSFNILVIINKPVE